MKIGKRACFQEVYAARKLFFSFAWKTYDKIRTQRSSGLTFTQPAQNLTRERGIVAPAHAGQDGILAPL